MNYNQIFGITCLLLGFSTGLHATATYSNLTAFLSATGPLYMEGFENQSIGTWHTSYSFDDYKVNCSANHLHIRPLESGSFSQGAYPTEGNKYLLNSGSQTMKITFNTPINSLGFDMTDWGDVNNNLLTLSTNMGESFTIADQTPKQNGNVFFFGFLSNTLFTEVTFSNTNYYDNYGLDQTYYGMANAIGTPLPGVAISGLLAGSLLSVFRLRRKK